MKRPDPLFLSIIIPVYNGGEDITANIKKILDYMNRTGDDYEIIMIDDGSVDNTSKEISLLAGKDSHVRLLTNERNMGKGFSVKKGMLAASGDCLLFTDADLAYPIEQTEKLLETLKDDYDIAIGSRVCEESRFVLRPMNLRYYFRRHLLSRAFNLFVRKTFLKDIRDTQTGFKAFTKEAACNLFSKQKSHDFSFDLEILFLAQRLGYKIKEVPVTMEYHGGPSAVSMFEDSFKMFWRVGRVRFDYALGRYGRQK